MIRSALGIFLLVHTSCHATDTPSKTVINNTLCNAYATTYYDCHEIVKKTEASFLLRTYLLHAHDTINYAEHLYNKSYEELERAGLHDLIHARTILLWYKNKIADLETNVRTFACNRSANNTLQVYNFYHIPSSTVRDLSSQTTNMLRDINLHVSKIQTTLRNHRVHERFPSAQVHADMCMCDVAPGDASIVSQKHHSLVSCAHAYIHAVTRAEWPLEHAKSCIGAWCVLLHPLNTRSAWTYLHQSQRSLLRKIFTELYEYTLRHAAEHR